MDELDLKLKLIGQEPILADGYGYIEPLTVRDVVKIGYTKYMKHLNLLVLTIKDLVKDNAEVSEDELEGVSILHILLESGGKELHKELESALSLFLDGKATVDIENRCVFLDKGNNQIFVVNADNYDNIVDVLKWQNYINHFEDKKIEEAPMDEETRKFKKRLEELAKKRDEIKKKQSQKKGEDDENQIDFYDIISSISSKSYSINELNVMDLTIYQVYTKFKKLELIDQYDISIKSILAGAKDVKLKHWSSKTD